MGHLDIYAFAGRYEPNPGIISQSTGSPVIIPNEIFSAAVEIWEKVSVREIDKKHESLTRLFHQLIPQECGSLGAEMISPAKHSESGGHVSIRHPGAGPVSEALLEHGATPYPAAVAGGAAAVTTAAVLPLHAACGAGCKRTTRLLAQWVAELGLLE